MSDVFLLYHDTTDVTGEKLGQYLGCDHGKRVSADEYDTLIRWGSRVRVNASAQVVNESNAIRQANKKYQALERLADNGVNVPRHTQDSSKVGPSDDDYITYPALGRASSHARGTDIELILQQRDIYLTDNHHYVDYIPTELEYRMHVFDGEIVKIHEKRKRREADNHPYIRNNETGYVFLNPREEPPDESLAINAVETLGLDFGAVDVIRAEESGEEYVLEVNTAPSLDENNLRRYGDAFADEFGITPAGMDSVEFEE